MNTSENSFSATASRIVGSLFGRTSSKAMVAIDVAPKSIRSLHVRKDGRELVLDGYRIVRGLGEGGRTLTGALREALEVRTGNEPVLVSMSSPDATVRRIEVPPMSVDELREALPWEARRHVAGLADDAVLDAQILGVTGGENSASAHGPMSAVLVAFPRALYDGLAEAAAELDFDPAFVDIGALSAMNALLAYRTSFNDGPLALLDLSSPIGWFSIFTGNDLLLFRDLSQRAAEIDQVLAGSFGLDLQQLDTFRSTGKLPKGETATPAAVARALAPVTSELVEDLRSALLFLESRSGGSLDRVHLCGANASLFERYGIAEAISAQSGVPLERWSPLQGFRIGLVDEIGLRGVAGELSSAAGLVARFVQGE